MNDLHEVAQRIIPILEATIFLGNRNPRLHPIIQAVHDMQMAAKWLDTATKEQESIEESTETIRQKANLKVVPVNLRPPTLLGSLDTFEYLDKELKRLNSDLHYFKEVQASPLVKYKLDRTYDRLIESQFNIELAKFYFDQLNGNTK